MATDAWGIEDGYWDVAGRWHATPEETRQILRAAMGGHVDVEDPPPRSRPVWFVRYGAAEAIERPAELVLEDGTELRAFSALPPDLPLGYHDLHPSDGGPTTRLIIVPDRCHLPADLRTWGWTVQLYAARSRLSWGIGDLADLRRLATWSAGHGAGMIALNPLHAALPLVAQEPSPYFPSSRRYRSPLYLRVEEVPGWNDVDDLLRAAATAGRALSAQRRIDRDAVYELKLAALERLWAGFDDDPGFDAYCDAQDPALRRYAVFCALAEHHGAGWRSWPAEHRHPGAPGVARFALAHADRVRFHCWLQWLLDQQVAGVGAVLPVVNDIAIGVDPNGADGWSWQDVFAHGVRVGAPPDEFNTQGQDWGLPPLVPWKLRAAGYAPFAQTVRAALAHAGGIRIDHVMGLFRLFWIPPGGSPADGTYVRYPDGELLDVLALESARAGAWVVGEDLGTVEDEARRQLARRGVLTYKLFWFESEPPLSWPRQALAAVSTHDLPTVAGLWSGTDLDAQRAIGLQPSEGSNDALRSRLAAVASPDSEASVVLGAYRALAGAPSMVVTATLDDALEVQERPNMPGTTTEWPNWCLALPALLEDVERDPRVLAVAEALAQGRRPAAAGSAGTAGAGSGDGPRTAPDSSGSAQSSIGTAPD